MCGDPCMYDLTSSVVNDEKDVQCPKPEGLNREEVAGPYLAAVLGQELSPAGGGRSVVGMSHVFGDRACTDLESKTRKFGLDPTLTPQRILPSHATDECPEFGVSLLAPRCLRPG